MAFQSVTSGVYTVHPSANDVASTTGDGSYLKETLITDLLDAIAGQQDWVISGFDYASASGLTATMNAGTAVIAGYYVSRTGTWSVTLADDATNHVWLTFSVDGSNNVSAWGAEVNTTGTAPTGVPGYIKLATITTVSGSVTATTDERTTTHPLDEANADNITSGTLIHEVGGLEADVSAFDGILKISGGATAAVAAPSGAIVGTTDTQTLTNKTIDADNNTISNLAHGAEVDDPSYGVHGVTGSVVGTSDTQTLTNKTIDTASNTITVAASDVASGTLVHERGGLGADVSAYNGLVKVSGGVTSAAKDPNTEVTTKGDILVRGASTLDRLGAGSDGQVLTANSGATYGVEWAAAGGSAVTVTAAEAITAGDPVELYDDGGTAKAKKILDLGKVNYLGAPATSLSLLGSPGSSEAYYWGQCNVTTDKCFAIFNALYPYILSNDSGTVTATLNSNKSHTYRNTYGNALKLEDSKFLYVTGNGSGVSMSIGTVSGTTITWGTEFTTTAAYGDFAGMDVMGNGSKVVVVYATTSTQANILTLTWSGTTLTLENNTSVTTVGKCYYAESAGQQYMYLVDSGSPYSTKAAYYSSDVDYVPTVTNIADAALGHGFVVQEGEGKIVKGYNSDTYLRYLDGTSYATSLTSSPSNKYPYQYSTHHSSKNAKNYFNKTHANATILRGFVPESPSPNGYLTGTWMMTYDSGTSQVSKIDVIYDYEVFGGDTLYYGDSREEVSIFDISTDKFMLYNHDRLSYVIVGYSASGFTEPYTTGDGSWSRHPMWDDRPGNFFTYGDIRVLDSKSYFTAAVNGTQIDWSYTKFSDEQLTSASVSTNGTLSLGGHTLYNSGIFVARLTDSKVVVGYNTAVSTDYYVIIDINTTTGAITEGSPISASIWYNNVAGNIYPLDVDVDNWVVAIDSATQYMSVMDFSSGTGVNKTTQYTLGGIGSTNIYYYGAHNTDPDDEWMVVWLGIFDGAAYGVAALMMKKDGTGTPYLQKYTSSTEFTYFPTVLYVDGRDIYYWVQLSGVNYIKKVTANVSSASHSTNWKTVTTVSSTAAGTLSAYHFNAGSGSISQNYHYAISGSDTIESDLGNAISNVSASGAGTYMTLGYLHSSAYGISFWSTNTNRHGGTETLGLVGQTNLGKLGGIAQTTASAGQDVSVAPAGTIATVSGLTTGKKYYMPGNSDGTPFATSGVKEVGFAANSTNIIIKQA